MDLEKLVWEARAGERVPRIHPNGFLQVDVSADTRLHVWPKVELPRPKTFAPIHDHTFSFLSRILVGEMVNTTYRLVPNPEGGTHRITEIMPYMATGQQGVALREQPDLCDFEEVARDQHVAGSHYNFPAFAFHTTDVEQPTATLMTVNSIDRTAPSRIAYERGDVFDPDFSRDCLPSEELWTIIANFATTHTTN